MFLLGITSCFLPLQYSPDDLHRDTEFLFNIVLLDPEFEGLLPKLSHSTAVKAVAETMDVLHSTQAPQVQWVARLLPYTTR